MKYLLGFALLLAAVHSSEAQAREPRAQLNQTDAVAVDPHKSYIFFRATQGGDLRFFREPTAAERAAYDAERAAAYETARANYVKTLAIWQVEIKDYREEGGANSGRAAPVRPDPVTPETFGYPPLELRYLTIVSGGPQFTRGPDGLSYLMAVEPGTYSLYGRMALGQNGTTIGTCLCMGSVKFQAKAGQIVDLGMLHYPAAEASKEERNGHVRLASHALTPFDSSMSVPARLAGLPVVPADLRAADKMPNYFGIMIDRLPAIPGVLAYQRDKVIDVKAGGAEATTGH